MSVFCGMWAGPIRLNASYGFAVDPHFDKPARLNDFLYSLGLMSMYCFKLPSQAFLFLLLLHVGSVCANSSTGNSPNYKSSTTDLKSGSPPTKFLKEKTSISKRRQFSAGRLSTAGLSSAYMELGFFPDKMQEWRDGLFLFSIRMQKNMYKHIINCTAHFIALKAFVTAYHCIEGREEYINSDSALVIHPKFPDHKVAGIIDVDKELDVAIIEVQEEFKGILPSLKMKDLPKHNEYLYSVGYPHSHYLEVLGSYRQSLLSENYSFLIQSEEHSGLIAKQWEHIRSSMSSTNGISGAPVFNSKGEFVGIVTHSISLLGQIKLPELRFTPTNRWAYLIEKHNLAIHREESYYFQILEYFGLN